MPIAVSSFGNCPFGKEMVTVWLGAVPLMVKTGLVPVADTVLTARLPPLPVAPVCTGGSRRPGSAGYPAAGGPGWPGCPQRLPLGQWAPLPPPRPHRWLPSRRQFPPR